VRNVAYRVVQVVYWISLAVTAGLGGIAKFDLSRLKGHADVVIPQLTKIQQHAWISIFTAGAVAACTFLMKIIGPPWVREAIKKVLNEMHAHAFANRNRAEFHDRITLFRYQRFCVRRGCRWWRLDDYLVPFIRSGFLTQKSSVVFRVPDDGNYNGIAGFAYSCNVSISREHLPDVSPNVQPTEEDYQKYAEETFVDIDWLKKERSTARSLYGIPVRVDGKPWGAIVVDSRQESIPNSNQVVKSYFLVASVLGQLLKRS
jgi:hypothetical protein